MSHWIEYQIACFGASPAEERPAKQRYLIAVEAGSNNLTETGRDGRERRVRAWYVGMFGTEVQILRQAVRAAAACEGGCLRLEGRSIKAEAYVGRVRRCLHKPQWNLGEHACFSVLLPPGHPLLEAAEALGYVTRTEKTYGEVRHRLSALSGATADRQAFFDLLDPFIEAGQIEPAHFDLSCSLPSS
jgi:hypothetical protein